MNFRPHYIGKYTVVSTHCFNALDVPKSHGYLWSYRYFYSCFLNKSKTANKIQV